MAINQVRVLRPLVTLPDGSRICAAHFSDTGDATGGDVTYTIRLQPVRDPRWAYRLLHIAAVDGGDNANGFEVQFTNLFTVDGGTAFIGSQIRVQNIAGNLDAAAVNGLIAAIGLIVMDNNPGLSGLPTINWVVPNVNAASYRLSTLWHEIPLSPDLVPFGQAAGPPAAAAPRLSPITGVGYPGPAPGALGPGL